jgi:hypothetical protein
LLGPLETLTEITLLVEFELEELELEELEPEEFELEELESELPPPPQEESKTDTNKAVKIDLIFI